MTAANGREAVEKSTAADLILMDCDMPVKDGLTALTEIRERYADIPVMMMSGLMTPDRESKLIAMGATECISKPIFDWENIRTLVTKYS